MDNSQWFQAAQNLWVEVAIRVTRGCRELEGAMSFPLEDKVMKIEGPVVINIFWKLHFRLTIVQLLRGPNDAGPSIGEAVTSFVKCSKLSINK